MANGDSAQDGVRRAENEMRSLNTELAALWQEYIACDDDDGDRKIRMLHTYYWCHGQRTQAIAVYCDALGAAISR